MVSFQGRPGLRGNIQLMQPGDAHNTVSGKRDLSPFELTTLLRCFRNLAFFCLRWQQRVGPTSNDLGDAVLGPYVIPFEVVSVLLLAALVGAVAIARRD